VARQQAWWLTGVGVAAVGTCVAGFLGGLAWVLGELGVLGLLVLLAARPRARTAL
jgi:hypothetical protein